MADKQFRMRALVTIQDCSNRLIATGEVDDQGNPILNRETIITPRGAVFKANSERRDELLRSGAAEEVKE